MKKLTILFVLLLTSVTLGETYRYTPGQAYLLADAFMRLESGDHVVLERGTYRLNSGNDDIRGQFFKRVVGDEK